VSDDDKEFSEKVWASVRKNAAEVRTWPAWKLLGSGLLDASGNALPAERTRGTP
jgi:hypothetical protein